ncbi:hypothetical protein J2T58_001514 [Methanocalculus alkaliphilus]|uniref:hypothetical protein n=1 Tax=Methanocalculus alkaliphilus TaxID=768730 RepID=UPI00209C8E45|nr:hypothetical protein [Methanocalculus alkaliphilus]MCP1715647.1 hypothetical protein [Methanocalculus alkaliphilus]
MAPGAIETSMKKMTFVYLVERAEEYRTAIRHGYRRSEGVRSGGRQTEAEIRHPENRIIVA